MSNVIRLTEDIENVINMTSWFSDVFRRQRKGACETNGLIKGKYSYPIKAKLEHICSCSQFALLKKKKFVLRIIIPPQVATSDIKIRVDLFLQIRGFLKTTKSAKLISAKMNLF